MWTVKRSWSRSASKRPAGPVGRSAACKMIPVSRTMPGFSSMPGPPSLLGPVRLYFGFDEIRQFLVGHLLSRARARRRREQVSERPVRAWFSTQVTGEDFLDVIAPITAPRTDPLIQTPEQVVGDPDFDSVGHHCCLGFHSLHY